LTVENTARVQVALKFIKTVQQAILLHVNLAKRTPAAKVDPSNKHAEERSYTAMIEDFCRNALKSQSVYLLKLMPQLMHAGFISPKTKDQMVQSLENLLVVKDEEHNLGQQLPDGSPSKKRALSDADATFVRKECIEAIKQKWLNKAQIKGENVGAPQFEAVKEESEEIIIDTARKDDDEHVDEMIGQKRRMPVNEASKPVKKQRKQN
jgi:hypothetical protein